MASAVRKSRAGSRRAHSSPKFRQVQAPKSGDKESGEQNRIGGLLLHQHPCFDNYIRLLDSNATTTKRQSRSTTPTQPSPCQLLSTPSLLRFADLQV